MVNLDLGLVLRVAADLGGLIVGVQKVSLTYENGDRKLADVVRGPGRDTG